MQLTSNSFQDGGAIPAEFAFADIDPVTHVSLSANRNPHLVWKDAPAGTKSFALICHDPDVPSSPDDVNAEGREVPASLPRIDFYHWILLDIRAEVQEIGAGEHSKRVTPKGKAGPNAPGGMRHGVNDYTSWFVGEPSMEGDYFGYDGPGPPWNDQLPHRYVFTIYALDVPRLDVEGELAGADVRDALKGHVLAEASLTGVYSLNPRVRNGSNSWSKP